MDRELTAGAIKRAKALRANLSPPELRLWLELKAQSRGRCPFRKQHAVGPYVLDFYCPAARLAVEVDGWSHGHGDQPQKDERRDRWLGLRGVRVERISAADVMRAPGDAAAGLLNLVEEISSPPPAATRPPPP